MQKTDQSFDFLPIPEVHQEVKKYANAAPSTTKISIAVNAELLEKIKSYAYWEGFTQQQIALQALENFFRTKSVKARPPAVQNRPKVGRKRKS